MQTVGLAAFLVELVDDVAAVGGDVRLNVPRGIDVHARPVAMRRALRNVIENAIRYDHLAEVAVRADDDVARIMLSDKDGGIPEADLERVFDPFVQVEKSRNMETEGIGLGLSIARTVIHAHGGDIKLSNIQGKGVMVDISIPLASEGKNG